MEHIARGNIASPYVSLTRSFGVAENYALHGRGKVRKKNPAFVYELEVPEDSRDNFQLIDPVRQIVLSSPEPPYQQAYHHDGDQRFLVGVVSADHREFLKHSVRLAPGSTAVPRTPNLSKELETLALALRDSEILAVGTIAPKYILNRYDIT